EAAHVSPARPRVDRDRSLADHEGALEALQSGASAVAHCQVAAVGVATRGGDQRLALRLAELELHVRGGAADDLAFLLAHDVAVERLAEPDAVALHDASFGNVSHSTSSGRWRRMNRSGRRQDSRPRSSRTRTIFAPVRIT